METFGVKWFLHQKRKIEHKIKIKEDSVLFLKKKEIQKCQLIELWQIIFINYWLIKMRICLTTKLAL